mmetsp:Transcript_13414/g.35193  ORF Transcript_13414/g.35193 Transcript_13414/m.35193 type:complete len:91 (-) Transcript_13414:42-314(-)
MLYEREGGDLACVYACVFVHVCVCVWSKIMLLFSSSFHLHTELPSTCSPLKEVVMEERQSVGFCVCKCVYVISHVHVVCPFQHDWTCAQL